ncbi:MAG: MFS transporter [Anaerolineae bacterium]
MAIADDRDLYPDYGRNALALALDTAFFHTALNFISTTTVLLTFLATLVNNEVLIGVAAGIINSAWLLPQLLVAGLAARQPRMKPLLVKAVWYTRPVLLPLALAIWWLTPQHPGLTFGITVAAIFVFFVGDAFASVPWFALLGRVLPPTRRGRVIGAGQVAGGLGGVVAGLAVRSILSNSERFAYPGNYALLVIIGWLIFFGSGLAVLFIREPQRPAPKESPPSVGQVFRMMPSLLASDHPFRKVIITRLLLGFSGIASSFYVLYATQRLGFPAADMGYFITAQVIGSVGSGLLLGYVQDRWGPLRHMRINIAIAMLPPLCALLAGLSQRAWPSAVIPLYLALYFFFGVAWSSVSWPFFNWMLEYAPDERRPLYIGLTNTLGAITMVAPTIGGLLVRSVSYPAAFIVSIVFALAAMALSFRLPCTRRDGARYQEAD